MGIENQGCYEWYDEDDGGDEAYRTTEESAYEKELSDRIEFYQRVRRYGRVKIEPTSPGCSLEVQMGYGQTLGNRCDMLSGHAYEKLHNTHWVRVAEIESGVFRVQSNTLTSNNAPCLGLVSWDEEVVNLDRGFSDEAGCFGMSSHLRWKDVEITPQVFFAPSVDRLREALSHVVFSAWDPADI